MLQQIASAESILCATLRERDFISPATISHHLKELTEAGLVRVQREGRLARLTLRRPTFNAYLKRLGDL